eukprot:5246157-Lingulodinium_polyedra.AAC.1
MRLLMQPAGPRLTADALNVRLRLHSCTPDALVPAKRLDDFVAQVAAHLLEEERCCGEVPRKR